MHFTRVEKVSLGLFTLASLIVLSIARAQSIEDNLTPIREDSCLARCERYRQECLVSASGDSVARSQCESTVSTPCVDACNLGRPFTPPPYPKPQPKCEADEWRCGDWSACSANGTQTRSCDLAVDCLTAVSPIPATEQTCTPPAPEPPKEEAKQPEPTPTEREPATTPKPQPTPAPPTRVPTVPVPAPEPEPTTADRDDGSTDRSATPDDEGTSTTADRGGENDSTGAGDANASDVRRGSGGGSGSHASDAMATCQASGLSAEECRAVLVRGLGFEDCAAQGIVTRESCEAYLTQSNGGVFPGCEAATPQRCEAIKTALMVRYIEMDTKEVADKVLQGMIARGEVEPIDGITSISDAHAKDAAWWRSTRDESAETSDGVIVIDSDRDGLPDDFERQLGLDPFKADTDGDGIDDDAELRAGTAALDATARAIVNRSPLSQPHGTGETDDRLTTNVDSGRLYGLCDPNATCLVFVYSYIPTVFTVKADANGEWSYDLSDKLSEGSHVAYVTVSNEDGAIERKSSPLSFFVTPAQAVTTDADDLLGPTPIVAAQQQGEASQGVFVAAALAAVLAAGGAAAVVMRRKPTTVK